MKKLLGVLLIAFGLSMAAAPTFVNLVPITSLSNTTIAATADSVLFYVVRGASYATYGKIRLDTIKSWLNTNALHYSMLDTISGYTTVVTDSMYCTTGGGMVRCRLTAATGTSNATTHVISRLVSAIRPSVAQIVSLTQLTDNGAVVYQVKATINTDGTISLANNGSAWTASGTFAVAVGLTFGYQIY